MKRKLKRLFNDRSDKLAVALALLSVGFTLMTFGYAGYSDAKYKEENINSYVKLLKQELYINYKQATLLTDQYKKHKPLTFIPAYRDSIYQAGLNNGHFYEIDTKTQTTVIAAYTLVNADEKSITQLDDSEGGEQRSAALNGQAIAVKALFEKPSQDLKAREYSAQTGLFITVLLLGVFILTLSIFFIARLLLRI